MRCENREGLGAAVTVASAVIEVSEGMCGAVLDSLAHVSNLNVYGFKENQIVTVIEGDAMADVEKVLKELYSLEHVIGVYPVYAGDHE